MRGCIVLLFGDRFGKVCVETVGLRIGEIANVRGADDGGSECRKPWGGEPSAHAGDHAEIGIRTGGSICKVDVQLPFDGDVHNIFAEAADKRLVKDVDGTP